MITRFKVNGFKSLMDVNIALGPFTCIAGANAVGKSNLFDALVFLSHLADNTIIQAAKSVRSDQQRYSDVRDIFYKRGEEYYPAILFEIDMIIPQAAEDDLGQKAKAAITTVKYVLELSLNNDPKEEPIQIRREELIPISTIEAKSSLLFNFEQEWFSSSVIGRRPPPNRSFLRMAKR